MTNDVNRFLRFLCIVEGRTAAQCATALTCSTATVRRYIDQARELQVGIRIRGGVYQITDSGPFDLAKLKQMRWPAIKTQGA